MNSRRAIGLVLIGVAVGLLALKLSKTYDPSPGVLKLAGKSSQGVQRFVRKVGPDTLVYTVLVFLPAVLGAGLLLTAKGPQATAGFVSLSPGAVPGKAGSKTPAKGVQTCLVLDANPNENRLWQFDARGGTFVLKSEQAIPVAQPLPSSVVSKSWHSFWQPRLNVAWLPADQVFFRVARFPRSDANETASMVELQLEKLSPMPVTQVVWTFHIMPGGSEKMQTVVVTIVARSIVEQFLGQLESRGYLADRLELPLLDQLQATPVSGEGAWLYPQTFGGKSAALVAWWYDGILQNLDLINLPLGGKAESLMSQLNQMAWAGELEGWLSSPPIWHIVAEEPLASEWRELLATEDGQRVEIIPPVPPSQLAALTAKRAGRGDLRAGLLPGEFSTRYHQQFVDRLWMRALLAVFGLYLAGVAVYGVAVAVRGYRTSSVEQQLAAKAPEYTNTLQLEARYRVLKDREELKYAALDCWKVVAELLPENLSLDDMNFSDGKRLTLHGTAPSDQTRALTEFEGAIRRNPIFDATKGDNLNYRQRGATVDWSFTLELKRSEIQ
jgi:hypothetical protein